MAIRHPHHPRHPVLRTAGLPLGTWTPDEADNHMYPGLNGCGPQILGTSEEGTWPGCALKRIWAVEDSGIVPGNFIRYA